MLEHTRDVTAGRAQLIAGCNAGSTRDAIAYGEAARDLGYDAVMLAAPYTSLPTQRELASHYATVAAGRRPAGRPLQLPGPRRRRDRHRVPRRGGRPARDRRASRSRAATSRASSPCAAATPTASRSCAAPTTRRSTTSPGACARGWPARRTCCPASTSPSWTPPTRRPRDGARLFDGSCRGCSTWRRARYNQKAKLGLLHLGIDCGEVRQPLLPLERRRGRAARLLDEALDGRSRRADAASPRRRSPPSRSTPRASRARATSARVFDIPGATAREKLHHLNEVDDSLRRILCFEPRGRPQASANLVFPSTDPGADAGFIILQADRAHAMSGSNTICVVTALLETGTVPMTGPDDGRGARDGGRAGAHERDVPRRPLRAGHARRRAVVRRGARRAARRARARPDRRRRRLRRLLLRARRRRRSSACGSTREHARDGGRRGHGDLRGGRATQIAVRHPEIPEIDFISYVMLTGDDDPAGGRLRGATVLSGRVDRSPCGTGNSARLACMAARGQAGVGSRFTATSLIDWEFIVDDRRHDHGRRSTGGPAAHLAAAAGWSGRGRPPSIPPTRTRPATCCPTSGT